MADLCDEVDENDSLTGRQVTVDLAHEQKLMHRCVAVFVFDKDGSLWVQPHVLGGGRLDHTVGGHVDAGESYKVAVYREMEEEIGLKEVELTELVTGFLSDEVTKVHMFGIYTCVAPEEWKFVPNEEVHELKKMNVNQILEMMKTEPDNFTGGFLNTMKKYQQITKLKPEING